MAVKAIRILLWACLIAIFAMGCNTSTGPSMVIDNTTTPATLTPPTTGDEAMGGGDPLVLDQKTGVPIATSFGFPIKGFTRVNFKFGFGELNSNFAGRHVGVDTISEQTPVGLPVIAPAAGIVRITSDTKHSGYGSDSDQNLNYYGCVILIEHELPNMHPIVSVMGHVQCEYSRPYNSSAQTGNPRVGDIVRKGQYIGHVAHYWHGSNTSYDWNHVHFGIRNGTYVDDCLSGYEPESQFVKIGEKKYSHPNWIDPLDFVEAHSQITPVVSINNAHQYPSGTMLVDPSATYWIVVSDGVIAKLTPSVMATDRYDVSRATLVGDEVISCFSKTSDITSLGLTYLYVRPGTNTVVLAYDKPGWRYDFVRWEALTSWGFQQSDIKDSLAEAVWREATYRPAGTRMLRPGTLVKGDADSEVSIVTWQQTRRPIYSGDIFDLLRFDWNKIVTIPQDVLDAVAGPRDNRVFGMDDLNACPAQENCTNGATCGGGVEDVPMSIGTGGASSVTSSATIIASTSTSTLTSNGTTGGTSSVIASTPMSIGETGGAPSDVICFTTNSTPVSPGSIETCACGGNATGLQVCQPDGTWGACYSCTSSVAIVSSSSVSTGGAPTIVVSNATTGGSPSIIASNAIATGSRVLTGGMASVIPTGGTHAMITPNISTGGNPPVVIGTGGAPVVIASTPTSTPISIVSNVTAFTLHYAGPVTGAYVIKGWWNALNGKAGVTWENSMSSCVDANPNDTVFDCDLSMIPSGQQDFIFDIYLPDGRYWGDESNDPTGGHGVTIGTVTITKGSQSLTYVMTPNNTNGQPYFNGLLSYIP
ncbi:MAG: M23 family metallopeptidase [Patescibacteria group bacterium]